MAKELLQNNNQTDSQERLEPRTSSNKRIAKNALMLYIRMFLTMIVGLYTSRVVLATLGVVDYGIYGVVGGVVAMMGFLNASMSGATSRFLTFELGRGDEKRLADTFSSALIVHIGIALIIFVLAETIGLWFLCNKLVIPEGRMEAAHWVYQCSILSAMLGITQAPYNASIIAHEKMDVYAYVEILNVSLKLLIVYLLVIGNFDKLKLYAVLTLAVGITIMLIYRIYCIRRFKETHFHLIWNKSILKPLLSFSGWDLYGNMAWSVRHQGANFILNMFYGPAINAANGIASTVQGVLMGFSSNITLAFKPQIIKSYATGNYIKMNQLIRFATKISATLLFVISLPVLVETKNVLSIWLVEVPLEAVFMTYLSLIINIFTCMSSIILIGIHASGRLQTSGMICGTMYILCLPIMYVLLNAGFGYQSSFYLFLIVSVIYCIINSCILKHNINQFEFRKYIVNCFFSIILLGLISYFLLFLSSQYLGESLGAIILLAIISLLLIPILAFVIILNNTERHQILLFLKKKLL